MERKTKQRILGTLVLIGLIIIFLPLFQDGKELPSEATLVKAPPFPDQSVQVASIPDQSQATEIPQTATPQPVSQEQNTVVQNNNISPDDTIVNPPTMINTQPPAMIQQAVETPVVMPKSPPTSLDPNEANTVVSPQENPKPAKPVTIKKAVHRAKPVHTNEAYKIKSVSNIKSTDKNGLASLTGPVWVIQIGSFKNKANALRLVNQLRLNGYSAFIQQVSTGFGDSTRVFVGPESHQASARALAKQLASEMRIRGIVISYKPLAL